MNAWRTVVGCVLVWSAVAVPGAAAQNKNDKQDAAAKCNIDYNNNDAVKQAYNAITVLQLSSGKPDDARKKIKAAIIPLTSKSDFGKDQLARNAVLGQALVAWFDTPGSPAVVPAVDLGYSSSNTGQVDVLAAADSAFTTVETAHPECAEQIGIYRQQPWAHLVNQIGPLLNGNKDDSAQLVLTRAITIYRGSPYDYYFQGQLSQRKKDWTTAASAYAKAVDLSTPDLVAKDTSVKAVKEFSEFSAAYAQLQAAQAMTGDQQKDGMKKAADLYRTYLKDYPTGDNIQPAQAGLTLALKASGDTASIAALWKDMAANPTKYSDAQLFDAGTQAFSSQQYETAVQLMEDGQKNNPYLRAGLFNLANAYWKNNQFDKMRSVADTLTKVDPDNPDNYQLLAIAYQGVLKATTDPKQKKALSDSVNTYVTAADKLPVHVTFNQFMHDGGKFTLAGTMQNADTKPITAAMTVKFIDKTGQVVTTQSTSVQLAPNQTKPFTMTAESDKIAAYRYDPIKP
jgi:tetratricopeptide (TPR) repeat protein